MVTEPMTYQESAEYGEVYGDDEEIEMASLLGGVDNEKPSKDEGSCATQSPEVIRFKGRVVLALMGTAFLFFFLGYSITGNTTVNDASVGEFSSDLSASMEGGVPNAGPHGALTDVGKHGPASTTDESSGDGVPSEIVTSQPTASPSEGTLAPTLGPTSSPSEPSSQEDDSIFLPHLPFQKNLQFRRVCAQVHSSILCLTLRFPFPVEPQDPKYNFPYPVDDRYYDLKQNAVFIDKTLLTECRNKTLSDKLSIDEGVKECLEKAVAEQDDPDKTVVALWTRKRLSDSDFDFFGVDSFDRERQGRRIDEFFGTGAVIFLGASPTPPIAGCIKSLFGKCNRAGMKEPADLCSGHETPTRKQRRLVYKTFQEITEDATLLKVDNWYPDDKQHGRIHMLPHQNLVQRLEGLRRARGFKKLRKLFLVVDFPIAHTQNQNMAFEDYPNIEMIQKGFTNLTMYAQSEQGRKELAGMGYDLQKIIAFDGVPQFNPTLTGAFDFQIRETRNEIDFLDKEGYPGWKPEYGSSCRGPLPPTSNLTGTNLISRQAFQDLGLDMNFYGRTWEFNNQYWFNAKRWKGKGGQLDCTHSVGQGSGLACTHKYFLMAMIDDHFDNLAKRGL